MEKKEKKMTHVDLTHMSVILGKIKAFHEP